MRPLYFLLIALSFAAPLAAQHDEATCKDLAHLQTLEAARFEQLKTFVQNPFTVDYDLRYHRLEWTVDPAVRFIQGEVTSYFVPLTDDFASIHFDLSASMQVTSVQYRGQAMEFVQHADDRLQVMFPMALPAGALDSVSVAYSGAPVTVGFGSFSVSTHNNVPVLWTLSEPYGAKEWWPCKQSLNDKIDSIDVIVHTPAAYRVASNGVLVDETTTDGMARFHWQHRYPIAAYLIAIGVTDYVVFSDFATLSDGQPLEILNYVYPESQVSAQTQLVGTIELMNLYNELFGDYPFANEKYGHAQFGFGGGMEHQTMSFMGGFSYSLQAHELAHQWFGDKVTCGSWSDIWLNEGFATYLTGLSNEFLGTPESWFNWKRGTINSVISQPGGAVYVADTTTVNRIFSGRLSYSKGSMVLHGLRWVMGDEAFFQGVRDYINAPHLAYNYAHTADLQTALEATHGQSLAGYFSDWVYNEGYPSYNIEWANLSAGRVQIAAEQTTSHPSVDFFEMPLPIRVIGQDRDTLLRLDHTVNGQTWEVVLPFAPTALEFDPTLWLISANNTVQQVLVSTTEPVVPALTLSPNPATTFTTIDMSALPQHTRTLALYTSDGRQVGTWATAEALFALPLADLPSGIYHLQLSDYPGAVFSVVLK